MRKDSKAEVTFDDITVNKPPKLPPRPVGSVKIPTSTEMSRRMPEDGTSMEGGRTLPPAIDVMQKKVSPNTYMRGVWGGGATTPSYSFQ